VDLICQDAAEVARGGMTYAELQADVRKLLDEYVIIRMEN